MIPSTTGMPISDNVSQRSKFTIYSVTDVDHMGALEGIRCQAEEV